MRCDAERCGAALRRGGVGARSYSLDRALSGSGGAAAPDQWEPRITSSAGEASGPGRGRGRGFQRLIGNKCGERGARAAVGRPVAGGAGNRRR